jgi:hypothetical protein
MVLVLKLFALIPLIFALTVTPVLYARQGSPLTARAASEVTPTRPRMGRPRRGEEKKPRPEDTGSETQFLEFPDLMRRWNVARQTLERWSREDPTFPPPYRFFNSIVRKYALADVVAYERAALRRPSPIGKGRGR